MNHDTKSAGDERAWLIESVRGVVIPALESRGFSIKPLNERDRRSPEVGTAFPFGQLRRVGPSGVEIVEIQLDKRGKAALRLNIGIAPPEGVSHAGGRITQEDVWVHYLDRYYVAYQSPLLRMWFSPKRWFSSKSTKRDYETLANRIVGIVPEIEQVLRDGKGGPHIRVAD